MKSLFITGSSGFVGSNFLKHFSSFFDIVCHKKGNLVKIDQDVVIHLAGKAHDLKKVLSSEEYYKVNTELTKEVFDAFLVSNAKVFITLSSVKAVADEVLGELSEEVIPNPITHYGMSKLLAEQYILSKPISEGKRVYVLRPCMIHGPGNKGNLNLLYCLVSKGLPWPLGSFENRRSYCSIDNLLFILNELIIRKDVPSGVYNISDDIALSTNEIIALMAESQNRTPIIINVSKSIVNAFALLGNFLKLPLNSERLKKLTTSYLVSNEKIKLTLGKKLPVSSKDGFIKTFKFYK
jgi:nucleoside-diphosphate-sugar epimerase